MSNLNALVFGHEKKKKTKRMAGFITDLFGSPVLNPRFWCIHIEILMSHYIQGISTYVGISFIQCDVTEFST